MLTVPVFLLIGYYISQMLPKHHRFTTSHQTWNGVKLVRTVFWNCAIWQLWVWSEEVEDWCCLHPSMPQSTVDSWENKCLLLDNQQLL